MPVVASTRFCFCLQSTVPASCNIEILDKPHIFHNPHCSVLQLAGTPGMCHTILYSSCSRVLRQITTNDKDNLLSL